MSAVQFLTLVGVMYLVPHMPRLVGQIMGCGFLIAAAIVGFTS